MMNSPFLPSLAIALLMCLPNAAEAQQTVPIRELAPVNATSSRTFGLILNIRPLAEGKVIVNDGGSRQLVVLDASLNNPLVLLDSATAAPGGNTSGMTSSYGPRASPLIQYLGDSTLFVDGPSLSLLLITPSGKPARVMAAPKSSIIRTLAASSSAFDRNGSLIFKGDVLADERPLVKGQPTYVLTGPDSVGISRANFETRTVDTLVQVKVMNGTRTETRATDDTVFIRRIVNPVSFLDEWAVPADGSIAIVRGHDYHIDWIRHDGTRTSTPKLPFDWKPLSESDKRALMDSVRRVYEKLDSTAAASRKAGAVGENGRRRRVEVTSLDFVPMNQIGDYQPPIRSGAVKADLDNNLWILPATSAQSKNGELVYDVVNNAGKLTHRVRLPVGHSIAGFGRGGMVYLMSKEADRWVLKRTTVATTLK